jgi:hypothetical protein
MARVTDNSPEFNPQSDWPSSSRQETRRGWANCYPVRNAQSQKPPDYAGNHGPTGTWQMLGPGLAAGGGSYLSKSRVENRHDHHTPNWLSQT